jgi:uncharacterized protein YceH (UPF0502 family)
MVLDAVQVRVLGALMEKEIATPETYPLSLNALVAACNQRSSRDPVMELTEEQVRQALHGLEDLGLTSVARDSRVAKYEHRIRTVLPLRRDETAVLCLLFLRGPQTPGELRSRSERLFSFDGLDAVESTLERMMTRPAGSPDGGASGAENYGPLVVVLPRQPGSREARYAHLLGGPVTAGTPRESIAERVTFAAAGRDLDFTETSALVARITALETEVGALRSAIQSIEARLASASGYGGESSE